MLKKCKKKNVSTRGIRRMKWALFRTPSWLLRGLMSTAGKYSPSKENRNQEPNEISRTLSDQTKLSGNL